MVVVCGAIKRGGLGSGSWLGTFSFLLTVALCAYIVEGLFVLWCAYIYKKKYRITFMCLIIE